MLFWFDSEKIVMGRVPNNDPRQYQSRITGPVAHCTGASAGSLPHTKKLDASSELISVKSNVRRAGTRTKIVIPRCTFLGQNG